MIIDRNTYESVFIDYLDGKLSDSDLKILISFLDNNPDLEQELKDLTSFSKQLKTSSYSTEKVDFSNLKRNNILKEEESNFDELCISFHEGLLNEKEEEIFLETVENDELLLHTFETYSHTFIKADKTIEFPNKSALKKHKKILWHQYASYAASLIFVLGFIFFIQDKKENEQIDKNPNYALNSYMDYPKVECLKNIEFASTNRPNKLKEDESTNSNNFSKTIREKHISRPVEYNNIELNNSNFISRKGKLAYSNFTDLEIYLNKIFEEKGINNSALDHNIEKIKNSNQSNPVNSLNQIGNFRLATSIDPIEFQKQILGSQPIE